MPITILCPEPEHLEISLSLSQELGLNLVSQKVTQLQLCYQGNYLQLIDHKNNHNPIVVDFVAGAVKHRQKYGGGLKQDLARAIGVKSNYKPTIIDTTCGLATDAYILASLGCRVTMLERNPIIAALVENALDRLHAETRLEDIPELQLVKSDALTFFKKIKQTERPDVIYLDPMFPERKKSALVKKEMRLLKQLVGADDDAGEVLQSALKLAIKRIVVKRPRIAPPLADKKPDFQLMGKANRFDVYIHSSKKY